MYLRTDSLNESPLTSGSAAHGTKSLANHRIFVHSNVGPAGSAEVKDARHIDLHFRTSQITRHQATDVFSQRDANLAGTLARPPLQLGFQRNLRPYHHDVYIIPSLQLAGKYALSSYSFQLFQKHDPNVQLPSRQLANAD
jgi:hypothetical protein